MTSCRRSRITWEVRTQQCNHQESQLKLNIHRPVSVAFTLQEHDFEENLGNQRAISRAKVVNELREV